MRWMSLVCCVWMVCVAWGISEAEACQPEPSKMDWSYPGDGATKVPINAIVALHFRGYNGKDQYDIKIKSEAGEAVAVETKYEDWSMVTLHASGGFKPNTRYTVSFTCLEPHRCYEEKGAQFSFTTGEGALSGAPSYPGAEVLKATYVPAVKTVHPCGPPTHEHFRLTVTGPVGKDIAYYSLKRAGSNDAMGHWKSPSATATLSIEQAGKELCYELTATNFAGVQVGATAKLCVTPQLKKEVEKNIKGGPEGKVEVRALGCSQAPRGSSSWPLWSALLLMGLGFLRRRP